MATTYWRWSNVTAPLTEEKQDIEKQASDTQHGTQVALFPIPNVVAFPGNNLPLHVFEPRYRKLVHDCVEQQRMVGVCHTVKAISTPAKKQSVEEMLGSNQTTYKPHQVFSAGHCEILETTDDGRLIANVNMSERLQIIEEVQSLPYRIVTSAPLKDHSLAAAEEEIALKHESELQERIHTQLIKLITAQSTADDRELVNDLQDSTWRNLTAHDYSFRIFQCIRFEADTMQHILELQSTSERLEVLWSLIGNAT